MPIHSFYIWGPTLIFGVIGTWVYVGATFKRGYRQLMGGRFALAVWSRCFIAMVLMALVGVTTESFNLYLLPVFYSVILGVGYFIHSVLYYHPLFKMAAYGWWLGAIGLSAKADLHVLVWFSLMIVLFQVLPSTLSYLHERRHKMHPKEK